MKTLEKEQAVALRNRGLSYREIQQQLLVSRGSLSRWLRDIELTQEQQARIHGTSLSIRKKFVEYNQRKRVAVQAKKAHVIRQAAAEEIGSLTRRELQLVGTALYWAEGCKSPFNSLVEFVNADPTMIALMMRWLRVCCEVPEHQLRGRVQIHDASRLQEVQQFWSSLTGIPTRQFTEPILKVSVTSRGKRGNCLPYGTMHIRIADVQLLTRIQGWIKGLGLAPSSSPA